MRFWLIALALCMLVACAAVKPHVDQGYWWMLRLGGFLTGVGITWGFIAKVRKARAEAVERHRLKNEEHNDKLRAANEQKATLKRIEAAVLNTAPGSIPHTLESQNKMLEALFEQRNPESIAALVKRQDVTDEHNWRTSGRFKLLFDDHAHARAFLNADGSLSWANKAFRDIFGQCDELTNDGWQLCIPERRRAHVKHAFETHIARGTEWHTTLRVCTSDSSEATITWEMLPEHSPDGSRVISWVVRIMTSETPAQ